MTNKGDEDLFAEHHYIFDDAMLKLLASLRPIIRAEAIKDVGERLQELALVGEFGLCLNMDKWDEFIELLKTGKLK